MQNGGWEPGYGGEWQQPGQQWTPQAQPPPRPPSGPTTQVKLGCGSLTLIGIVGFLWWGVSGSSSRSSGNPQTPTPPRIEPAAVAPTQVDPAIAFLQKLMATESLHGALGMLQLGDGDTDPGATRLAMWSTSHLTWADVGGVDQTSFGLVMKQRDRERGKHACFSGMTIEIESDEVMPNVSVAEGGLMTDETDVVRFIAVGDSAQIVKGSPARICMIVTGEQVYTNVNGGEVKALFGVGLFDLPANRRRVAAMPKAEPPAPVAPPRSGAGTIINLADVPALPQMPRATAVTADTAQAVAPTAAPTSSAAAPLAMTAAPGLPIDTEYAPMAKPPAGPKTDPFSSPR